MTAFPTTGWRGYRMEVRRAGVWRTATSAAITCLNIDELLTPPTMSGSDIAIAHGPVVPMARFPVATTVSLRFLLSGSHVATVSGATASTRPYDECHQANLLMLAELFAPPVAEVGNAVAGDLSVRIRCGAGWAGWLTGSVRAGKVQEGDRVKGGDRPALVPVTFGGWFGGSAAAQRAAWGTA